MYATALHVVHPELGERINAFLHHHGLDFVWPDQPWRLPEQNPGVQVREVINAPPGGNRVRAYLDVLAPDATSFDAIQVALTGLWLELVAADSAQDNAGDVPNPVVFTRGPVTIRFGVDPSLLAGRALELSELTQTIETLLARP